jgi:hypothetical protein
MKETIWDESDPEEMDDATLATAWEITNDGRQYEGVEEDRRSIGEEMASRLSPDHDPTIYCYGEPVVVRGIEREEAETHSGRPFTDIWAHIDFVDDPQRRTRRVNLSTLKTDGGLSSLTEHLVDRGLVPDWWGSNDPVPDSLD